MLFLMEDMYTLAIDRSRHLIQIALTGFWRPEATEAFCDEVRHQIAALGTGAGQQMLLCDLTDANVAPAETIAVLAHILANPSFAGIKVQRIAFYTPSALLRMQMGRVTGARKGVAVFETRELAETWLMEGRAVAA